MAEIKKVLTNNGGPARESFGKENVIPVYFNIEDPFCNLSANLNKIEVLARKGQLTEVFIAYGSTDESGEQSFVDYEWLGKGRVTSILGVIEYAREMLKRNHITKQIREDEDEE